MKEKLNVNLKSVTLKQLRALALAVQEGTFSGAANKLGVTPPAITLQMQQLEQAAAMPLVERNEEGLCPTDGGKEFLAAISKIESIMQECGENLEALNGIEGGRVRVGIVSTAKYFAPRALAGFVKIHPRVDVRLSVGNRQETLAAIENYELDLVIMGRPPEHLDIKKDIIGDHPHILIAPPGHPMAGRKNIPMEELASETFLLREEGSGTRLLMERLFLAANLKPSMGMEIGSNETIKQAVMADLGCALISAHTVAAELQENRLVHLDVTGLPVVRKWFVVKRKNKHLLPSSSALWDFLVSSGEEYFP